jgi:uncharacterized membrane protein YkvA (DUF1232 family)
LAQDDRIDRKEAMSLVDRWKLRARQLRTELRALYSAYRDPRVPWYARVVAACVLAYAFSPIDLIPDPIPILGYLDDLVLVPLGIALAIHLMPADVLREHREAAHLAEDEERPVNRVGAGIVILVWVALFILGVWLVRRWL